MNIITDQELADGKRHAFALGAGVAIVLSAVAYHWLNYLPPPPIGEPQIVMQKPSQTIARIPTLRDGKRIDCTVTIDQAKNVWSITC